MSLSDTKKQSALILESILYHQIKEGQPTYGVNPIQNPQVTERRLPTDGTKHNNQTLEDLLYVCILDQGFSSKHLPLV